MDRLNPALRAGLRGCEIVLSFRLQETCPRNPSGTVQTCQRPLSGSTHVRPRGLEGRDPLSERRVVVDRENANRMGSPIENNRYLLEGSRGGVHLTMDELF
jgi:hypothetical protein